jgi:hypothetical protein
MHVEDRVDPVLPSMSTTPRSTMRSTSRPAGRPPARHSVVGARSINENENDETVFFIEFITLPKNYPHALKTG